MSDCQLKLFDNTVAPILLYACEMWGYGDLSLIEKVHTDFMKHILNVKKSTPHIMLYGDLGRFPLSIMIKKRIIGFWYKLTHNNYNLSSILYKILCKDFVVNGKHYGWISNVKNIFDECGLSYIWQSQYYAGTKESLVRTVELSLKDQYKQKWNNDVHESSKCSNYRIYKIEHKLEHFYLDLDVNLVSSLVNFRLCNNHLPIEKGRWLGLDRNARKCNLCNLNEIGDEFHYLLCCPYFANERKKYLPSVKRHNINVITFQNIMCENDTQKLTNLSTFVKRICKVFRTPPGNT